VLCCLFRLGAGSGFRFCVLPLFSGGLGLAVSPVVGYIEAWAFEDDGWLGQDPVYVIVTIWAGVWSWSSESLQPVKVHTALQAFVFVYGHSCLLLVRGKEYHSSTEKWRAAARHSSIQSDQ
jgi:hypothetical protein